MEHQPLSNPPEDLARRSAANDDEIVMNLVELALAQPESEREAFLKNACAQDTELYAQVRHYVHWEQRLQGFLSEPLFPPLEEERPFEEDQLLDGRFRIVKEIARGGMGIVYEAFDEKLDRRIAIKCAKTGFRKRLPPEVRHASEISHPNVCKIFEIHTAPTKTGEIDFLTMEFLEGDTLSARISRGPLPAAEAIGIGRQICAGLAEAHRHQVVHGDLKSSNIILTPAEKGVRAVITDFGLARKPHSAHRAVPSEIRAGTPDYMAPELWSGEKATPASDVYALGVILYELLEGHRPLFPEANWELRLTAKPPAIRSPWNRFLQRCLHPDPKQRFQNAEEASRALAPKSFRWPATIAATIAVAVATAVFTHQRSALPKEDIRLAMLPIVADAGLATEARDLSKDIAAHLARLKSNSTTDVAFVSTNDGKQVITNDAARDVLHASHTLRVAIEQSGGELVLKAILSDARTGLKKNERVVRYKPAELHYAGVSLAGFVTDELNLPPPLENSEVKPAARSDYLAGMEAVRSDSTLDEALARFEKAAAADTDSALIFAGLAEAQWFKYFSTKDTKWLDMATESVRQAEQRNPDVAAVHRIAGILKENSGWYEQATADYQRAVELDPNNGDGHRRRGIVYEKNNQIDEALASYRKAIEVDPGHYRNYQALGAFYNQHANFKEASGYFRKAVALAPKEPNAHFALSTALMYLGQYPEAEDQLRTALQLGETPTALHSLGVVLMYEHRENEAIPYMTQALRRWPERYLWWSNLGNAYRRAGRTAEANTAYRRGLQLAESDIGRNPRSGYVRSLLAYLCARSGQQQRASSEIAQALQLSPSDTDVRWFAIATYEALNRREDSLALSSSTPDQVLADVSRYPDLADLGKDSRFVLLLASRNIK